MSGRLLERDTHTTHARDALAALSRRNRTLAQGRTFARATTMWERPAWESLRSFPEPRACTTLQEQPLVALCL